MCWAIKSDYIGGPWAPDRWPVRGVEGMIDAKRHVPLGSRAWDSAAAQTAIDDIVEDAHARLDEARFWPAHPQDEGAEDGDTSLYMGAAGVIWALDHLARTGATQHGRPLSELLAPLLEASQQHRAA